MQGQRSHTPTSQYGFLRDPTGSGVCSVPWFRYASVLVTNSIGNLINRRLCCPHCRGEGVVSVKRNVDVYIEPGLKNRSVIRVSEQGHQLLNKRAGDLVVIIKEKQHQRFKRANCDLGIGLHISVFESLLGFKQRITHLDGHIVEITNPPGVVVKV